MSEPLRQAGRTRAAVVYGVLTLLTALAGFGLVWQEFFPPNAPVVEKTPHSVPRAPDVAVTPATQSRPPKISIRDTVRIEPSLLDSEIQTAAALADRSSPEILGLPEYAIQTSTIEPLDAAASRRRVRPIEVVAPALSPESIPDRAAHSTPPVAPPEFIAQASQVPPAAPQTPLAPPVASPPQSQSPAFQSPTANQELSTASGYGRFIEQGTISLDDVRAMALSNNKDIAVLGHMPRLAASAVTAELGVFDPSLNLVMQGGHYDRQVSTQVEAQGAGVPVLKTTFFQPGIGLNQLYLEKLYGTGLRAQIGAGQNLTSYSPTGSFVFVNPAWQSSLNVILEQPLFRGRGAAWNKAPLRIAQANRQQSKFAFQATVNQVLRDAETAYWETYTAFQEFEVRDFALSQALVTVERERERLRIGEGSVPDVAQAEEQAEAFRIARTESESRLQDAQRALRRVMGIAPNDPRPIVPATAPSDAPLVVSQEEAVAATLARPEIAAQRAVVQAAQVEALRRRNGLMPDLSVRAIYSVTGLDQQWDGAWSSLGTWDYNDWTVGAVYRQPIGRRVDNALAQRANTALSLESARLAQMEHEIVHQLDAARINMEAASAMLEMHKRRREAAVVQLQARRELYLENRALLRDQLDAEARYSAAALDESFAKLNYQRAVTDWNYARGAMTDGRVWW